VVRPLRAVLPLRSLPRDSNAVDWECLASRSGLVLRGSEDETRRVGCKVVACSFVAYGWCRALTTTKARTGFLISKTWRRQGGNALSAGPWKGSNCGQTRFSSGEENVPWRRNDDERPSCALRSGVCREVPRTATAMDWGRATKNLVACTSKRARRTRSAKDSRLWQLSPFNCLLINALPDDGVAVEGNRGEETQEEPGRFVATTIEGFVQQLAVSYIGNGYFFYVTGRIPDRKDPRAVDRKFIAQYDLTASKWARARRKRAGLANVQYIRHERFFVLLATHGKHPIFEGEANLIRDARRVSIKFAGYSVSFRGGHTHVRIEQEQYKLVKSYLLDLAVRRSAESIESVLRGLPFEPYAPVRRQLLNILRGVNRARQVAGFKPVRGECLRLRRKIVKPFDG